jgi:hypothetical protein
VISEGSRAFLVDEKPSEASSLSHAGSNANRLGRMKLYHTQNSIIDSVQPRPFTFYSMLTMTSEREVIPKVGTNPSIHIWLASE